MHIEALNLLKNKLIDINGDTQVFENELMKKHTSFKIGGPADLLVMPTTEETLSKTLSAIQTSGIECFVMGNGSNLLVSDKGYRGVIVKVADNFNGFEIDGDLVIAQAGILLSTLSRSILAAELTGFEFASGIPGTVGGAVFMNEGAYGGEFKDIVSWVRVMDMSGKIKTYKADELDFAYRYSKLHETKEIAIACGLKLEKGDYEAIKSKTDELTIQRTTKQPLQLPSAGSTFRRPEGYFTGKLVDDAGLRGLKLGGAQVSTLHSGFVVNVDQATCQDVMDLIATIQKVIMDKFGVKLETEVRYLGEF
jgi:UDP-N-acetylmuramate dehydrogenase